MILTCPNCATDFLIADHLIGPEGREVKCDECGEVWVGGAEDPAPDPKPIAAKSKSPPASASASPDAETPNVMFAPPKAAPAPKRWRGRTASAAAVDKPARGQMPLVIVLMVLALTALGFIAFQGAVVKAWPAADGVYRAIGLSGAPAVRPSHG